MARVRCASCNEKSLRVTKGMRYLEKFVNRTIIKGGIGVRL